LIKKIIGWYDYCRPNPNLGTKTAFPICRRECGSLIAKKEIAPLRLRRQYAESGFDCEKNLDKYVLTLVSNLKFSGGPDTICFDVN
jgi:hypothetical protein